MHQYVANRNVFRACLKLFPPISGSRKLSSREFQTDGPATERLHLRAFAKFAANDLPYDRTDLEMTWLSWCSGAATDVGSVWFRRSFRTAARLESVSLWSNGPCPPSSGWRRSSPIARSVSPYQRTLYRLQLLLYGVPQRLGAWPVTLLIQQIWVTLSSLMAVKSTSMLTTVKLIAALQSITQR